MYCKYLRILRLYSILILLIEFMLMNAEEVIDNRIMHSYFYILLTKKRKVHYKDRKLRHMKSTRCSNR